jgi:predicted aminopeptidase
MLVETYAAKTPDAEKQARKQAIFAGMLKAYEDAKAGEAGLAGFDHWFSGYEGSGPNNASIVSIALYDDKVPAFRALLARSGGDLPTFYEKVRDLSLRPKAERDRALAALVEAAPTQAGADPGMGTPAERATEVALRAAR